MLANVSRSLTGSTRILYRLHQGQTRVAACPVSGSRGRAGTLLNVQQLCGWAPNGSSCGSASARIQRRTLCRAADGDAGAGDEAIDTLQLEIKVEGMMCGGCSSRVTEALQGLAGVKAVAVDLDTKLASVEVQAPSLMDALEMLPGFVKAIKDLGFEAEPHIEYQS